MRRILKPILLGLLISTAVMVFLYAAALMESHNAINLLVKLTIQPFNLAATFMEPPAPDDLADGMRVLDFMLLVAWLQIGLASAALLAGMKAVINASRN
jgi:hypothetical protein